MTYEEAQNEYCMCGHKRKVHDISRTCKHTGCKCVDFRRSFFLNDPINREVSV